MNWYQALQLAHALLEEMDFDPYKVIALSPDDLAEKLGGLEEDLAEVLLSFFEGLEDDTRLIDAAKHFAERSKDDIDLLRWQMDIRDWRLLTTEGH